MEVDQKHITTIRMHDAKGCEVALTRDGGDYQLQLISNHNLVNISLSFQDVRKLCQQIIQLDIEENWKSQFVPPPEFRSFFWNGAASRGMPENMAQWFMRMAGEMNNGRTEKVGAR